MPSSRPGKTADTMLPPLSDPPSRHNPDPARPPSHAEMPVAHMPVTPPPHSPLPSPLPPPASSTPSYPPLVLTPNVPLLSIPWPDWPSIARYLSRDNDIRTGGWNKDTIQHPSQCLKKVPCHILTHHRSLLCFFMVACRESL